MEVDTTSTTGPPLPPPAVALPPQPTSVPPPLPPSQEVTTSATVGQSMVVEDASGIDVPSSTQPIGQVEPSDIDDRSGDPSTTAPPSGITSQELDLGSDVDPSAPRVVIHTHDDRSIASTQQSVVEKEGDHDMTEG